MNRPQLRRARELLGVPRMRGDEPVGNGPRLIEVPCSPLSTPEEKCIGAPAEKCISAEAWGDARRCSAVGTAANRKGRFAKALEAGAINPCQIPVVG